MEPRPSSSPSLPPDAVLMAQRTASSARSRPTPDSRPRRFGSAAMLRRLRRRSGRASSVVGRLAGVTGRHVIDLENARRTATPRLAGPLMSAVLATQSEREEFMRLLVADREYLRRRRIRSMSLRMTGRRVRRARRTTLEHRREMTRLRVARFRARRKRMEALS